jgi:calpain-1 catalytic subunit
LFKIKSGALGLDEFMTLWGKIRLWCAVFRKHDKDDDGMMNVSELREAFHDSGLSVNRNILQILTLRYGMISKGRNDRVERSLSFDGFIHCCLKLRHAIDSWNDQGRNSKRTRVYSADAPGFTLDEVSIFINRS